MKNPARSGPGYRVLRVLLPPVLIALILGVSLCFLRSRTCDISAFDSGKVEEHLGYLSSDILHGRELGTDGNENTVSYLVSTLEDIEISPVENGNYRQAFSVVSPQIDRNPEFIIRDDSGVVIEEFEMYKDYRFLPSGRGKGLSYDGELVLAGNNLLKLDSGILDGRIVLVLSNAITERQIEYAYKRGCKGIFFASDRNDSFGRTRANQESKILDASGKSGADLLIGTISIDAYRKLKTLVGGENLYSRSRPFAVVNGLKIDVSILFPVTEASNVLGIIRGRDSSRTLIISANIDGLGGGTGDLYFPGAANGAVSMGILLETARVLSLEDTIPEKNIVFAFWNAGHQSSAGMDRYLQNPVLPSENTILVHLDSLGSDENSHVVSLASENIVGSVLLSKLTRYAFDAGHPARGIYQVGTEVITSFLRAGIPSVSVSAFGPRQDTYNDNPGNIRTEEIEAAADMVLNYIKRDVYGDVLVDYFSQGQTLLLGFVTLWLLIAYLLAVSYSVFPNSSIRKIRIESVYFSLPSEIIRKGAAAFLTAGSVLFIIIFIVNLPRDGMFLRVNGELITNQSVYLSLKETLAIIGRVFFLGGEGLHRRKELYQALIPAFGKTLSLTVVAMTIALVAGGITGIREANECRRLPGLRSAGVIVAASLPDVAVAIAGIWLFLLVARISPELSRKLALKQFILPAISLSILPGAYVSRISSITVRRELKRDYIQLAKAKGLSQSQIIRFELLPAIVTGIVDTISGLAAMMLTNLIVIEYMFGYRGIVNYLLQFHKRGDAGAFVIGALATGAIYGFYTLIGKTLAGLIDPDRRFIHK